MLELNASRNVAEITMNGEIHELYYRTPTTEEMVGFQAEGLVRKGRKIVDRMVHARLKYGLRVLIGFKKGTIGFDGELISSDPADKKHYRKDWKELLGKAAPQLVAAVGQAAFDGVRLGKDLEGIEVVSEVDSELLDEPKTPGRSSKNKGEGESGAPEGEEVPLAKG